MKQRLRLLFIWFILLLVFVFCLDWISFKLYARLMEKECSRKRLSCQYKYNLLMCSPIKEGFSDIFRKPVGTEYSKPPIYVFGCSFAYGQYLDEKNIFSSILSRETKRPVYNRAIAGGSFAHMYYQVDKGMVDIKATKPDYVIYIMIYDHIRRNHLQVFNPLDDTLYLRYKSSNGKLKLATDKNNQFPVLFLYKLLNYNTAFEKSKNAKYYEENFELVKSYLEETRSKILEQSPNTKFVLFLYDEDGYFWFFDDPRLSELKKDGFVIVKASELTNKKLGEMMRLDEHPTEEAWSVLTPALVKKLGL